MRSFSVTTTWGQQHWDVYAKRCVESIVANWPKEVKKIFYPDDTAQQIVADNCFYHNLKHNQPELQEFIDRNGNNELIKKFLDIDIEFKTTPQKRLDYDLPSINDVLQLEVKQTWQTIYQKDIEYNNKVI